MSSSVENAGSRQVIDTLASRMADYRQRNAQVDMINATARTVASGGANDTHPVLVVEGPCGVGKSVGYAIGAIPVAKELGLKVIIATGTVALQEQLVAKDLPELIRDGGMDFKFALVKGRGRYACLAKLAAATGYGAGQASLLDDEDRKAPAAVGRASDADPLTRMRQLLEGKKWNGERDSFPRRVEDLEWQKVSTDRAGCLAASCRFYQECPYYRARAAMHKAHVLVVNHDLLLSDAALGGGSILPAPEESVLVVDECHGLPAKALSHFATDAIVSLDNSWIRDGLRKLQGIALMCRDSESIGKAVDAYSEGSEVLMGGLEDFYRQLESLPEVSGLRGKIVESHQYPVSATHRFAGGLVPDALRQSAEVLAEAAEGCAAAADAIGDGLAQAIEAGLTAASEAEKVIGLVGELAGRMGRFWEGFDEFSRVDPPRAPPTARWVEARLSRNGRLDLHVETSPIASARQLEGKVWGRYAASVACSATIRTMGSFDRFKRRAGLALRADVECLALPSPFDYARNARLVIPHMRHLPTSSEAFTAEVIERLPGLIEPRVGTLVLFCSRWQMQKVYNGLQKAVQDKILMQGSMDHDRLIKTHVKAVEAGQGSVLFGLASLAEGLDLPGKACQHVIVTKLPFATPDSPIDAAINEWLESMGRNPFLEVTVPDACLKLIQAAGRLLRTESDYGEVTILDRRLVTARWGRSIMDALPPFARVIEGARQARAA